MNAIEMAERGWLPEPALRFGIRRLLRERLRSERRRHADRESALAAWIAELREKRRDRRAPFERAVSVEMFEHMRNWREWLVSHYRLVAPRPKAAA